MKANLAFLFLFLPALCFAQNRNFDKDYSRYELNFNVLSNGDDNSVFNYAGVSAFATYALEETIKPGAGLQYNYDGSNYSLSLPASITFTNSDNRINTFARLEGGALLPFAKSTKPGFMYGVAAGFQYAMSKSAGINFEGFYKHLGYGADPYLWDYFTFNNEYRSITTPSYYSISYFGFSVGLNFRLKK
ncbi:MAG: hypothetical protein JST55_14805 [Bacteroidetes bacterium]|nr:hypothetical protein [Bacteroidota bacterium]